MKRYYMSMLTVWFFVFFYFAESKFLELTLSDVYFVSQYDDGADAYAPHDDYIDGQMPASC